MVSNSWQKATCNMPRYQTIAVTFQATLFWDQQQSKYGIEWLEFYFAISAGCYSWLAAAFLTPPHGDADGIIIFKFLCSFSCFSILKATMSSTEKRQQSSCQSTKCNTGYHFFKAECEGTPLVLLMSLRAITTQVLGVVYFGVLEIPAV